MDQEEAWDESAETLLLEWAEKSAGLRWLHMQAAKRMNLFNDLLSVPVVITSTLAGLGQLSEDSCGKTLTVLLTIVNLASAVLISTQRYVGPAEKASTHAAVASDYSKLYRKIAAQLSLPKRRREPVIEFCTACRTEYDRLVSSSLDVPQACIRSFKKRFAANTQSAPEVVSGGIETIRTRRPSASEVLEQVIVAPMDTTATGAGVQMPAGVPNRGRRMRRASTVINDALIAPGTSITPFQSTRLPDVSRAPAPRNRESYQPEGEEQSTREL